ncbi:LysR family transcriptional regulator [Novosphingobium terrae]|uniref:LysR family transcriptional regulator n=1 Tax=Novosphingobium terrae TaxID=2726189 RepID=UPI00197D7814|nr:LysR substrate-binding domain-containing protein [Novosphingobium terrae]
MSDLDLNLLRVFDALMELRSVTRVAQRLGLTQSAVSHALGRLRRMLDDPLFVRGPRGLQPSARAEQIAPGISVSLQQLRDALAPARFTPATAVRSFTLAAGAYFCRLIVPGLVEQLRHEAPQISLRVVPLIEDGAAMLDRGIIDLALGAVQTLPSRFVIEPLFDDDMVWIAARTNPLASGKPDPALVLRAPRIRIATQRPFLTPRSPDGEAAPSPDQFVEWDPQPVEHAPATVYDSQTAAAIIARTDAVACVPRRIAEREKLREDILILMPAARSQMISLAMIWHGRHRSDPALTWLRALLLRIAEA